MRKLALSLLLATGVATPVFEPVQPELLSTGGAFVNAWADFDGDGDLDLFVGFGGATPNRLYRNDAGTLTDVAAATGIADARGTLAAAWADFDGDGDPDLVVGFAPGAQPVIKLYRNDGGKFTDVAREAGVARDSGRVRQLAWVDYDGDGDLDLFVAFRDRANAMFRNDGGHFVDVAAEIGLADPRRTVGAVWFDYDEDGDLDLVTGNMDGDANGLMRNDNGHFTDVAEAVGVAWGGREPKNPMNGTVRPCVADVNNDGHLDLIFANYGKLGLFLNQGKGRFTDASAAWKLDIDGRYDTCALADFDNDGRVDLYVNGTVTGGTSYKDYLFRNTGTSFADVTPDNIKALEADHGVEWADFDGDGDEDLALTGTQQTGMHLVMRNMLALGDNTGWLRVAVVDAGGHASLAGAEVRVYAAGTRRMLGTRVLDSGSGYNAQNAMPVQFGLGKQRRVDVEVIVPRGGSRRVAVVRNVDAQVWRKCAATIRVAANGGGRLEGRACPGKQTSPDHVHQSEQLGSVHFPTSCSTAVVPTFDRAVALLHSFEFGSAIRGFTDVLARDSSCAMAHWGIALSRWSNPMAAGNRTAAQLQPGRDAASAATRLSGAASERERLYIAAVGQLYKDFEHVDQAARVRAYERAMDDLSTREPADTEAKIFHAISLAAAAPPTDKTYANQLKAGSILEPIFAKQPNHPGLAHYIIHAYDVPALAPQAAAAARRYAMIAPSAAHALHMPSHTFTRVGMWQESVDLNLRSIDVATRNGAIGEALHASDYAEYAYLQMGKRGAAKAVVDGLPALAARFDPGAITGAAPPSAGFFALAAIPARYALERRAWKEAAALQPAASAFPWADAITYFARALGAAHTGNLALAHVSIDSLDAIQNRLRSAEPYWAEQVAIQRLSAQAWLELAEHRTHDALEHMREAAVREDATEKSAVTPGPLAPARELLGDMLMTLVRPQDALVEYRATLTKEPNRYRALHGAERAAFVTGDLKAQAAYAAQLKRLTGKD